MGSIVPVQLWLQRFVACLLLFAVGTASAVGLVAGYRCDCDSAPRFVSAPRCDEATCHPGRAHADGCTDGDADDCGDCAEHSHEHQVVRHKVEWAGARQDIAKPLETPPAVSAPLGGENFLAALTEVRSILPAIEPSPPPGRLAFLTTVLLI